MENINIRVNNTLLERVQPQVLSPSCPKVSLDVYGRVDRDVMETLFRSIKWSVEESIAEHMHREEH